MLPVDEPCCNHKAKPKPYPFGTTGLVYGNLKAVVLSDLNTHCGGDDDLKVCYNFERNEWIVGWVGADEFKLGV